VQPNNVGLIEYGRFVMRGELKVKCQRDIGVFTQSMRYAHSQINIHVLATLKLYILLSGNADNDVVLVSTVVEDGSVLKLRTE